MRPTRVGGSRDPLIFFEFFLFELIYILRAISYNRDINKRGHR